MGVIKNGYLKGVSGKVDNVIVSKWKDIDVVKGLSDIRNDNPTSEQVVQRNRFKMMVDFASLLKFPIILPIWNNQSRTMTGFNLFIKMNSLAFNEKGTIDDYSKLMLTKGDIEKPTDLKISNAEAGSKKLDIEWSFDPVYAPLSSEDIVNVVIFKKDQQDEHPKLLFNLAERNETKAEISVEDYMDGDELNIFTFHSRDSFKLFSETYFQKIILDFSAKNE